MIQNKKLLIRLTIDNYIRQVELSKSQRPKYYEWDGITIKSGSKKLLQKYIKQSNNNRNYIIRNNGNVQPINIKEGYVIIGFKGDKVYSQMADNTTEYVFNNNYTKKQLSKPTKFILCKEIPLGQYEKVIANETQVGNPKMHIIRGQDFYVGLNPFIRNKLVHKLKESYYNKFKTLSTEVLDNLVLKLNQNYPLIIEMEIKDTVKSCFDTTKKGNGRRWDVGNRAAPYMKTFLDFLVKGYKDEKENYLINPLIIDDDRLHISSGDNAYFTPIEEESTPALVFYIYSDTRVVFKKYLENDNNRLSL